MSETATKPRVANPFDARMEFEQPSREMVPVVQGPATDRATAAIITAQRVAIKRNVPDVLKRGTILATAAARKFYYSIPFKKKQPDGSIRVESVEGATIGCAMAAVGVYGNCAVEAFPASETQTHWTFLARFVDYETGLSVTRSFNQRKSQSTGMRDEGRNADIVFQIGQSKAMRNVIVSSLSWLVEEMFAAAKSGVLERIQNSPDAARAWLIKQFAEHDIPLNRVERVIGRTADKWLVHDMAKLFAEIQALSEGFADADDLYPSSQAAADEMREAAEEAKNATASEAGASRASEGEKSSSASTDATPQNTGTAADKAAAGEAEKVTRKRAPKEKPAVVETAAGSEARPSASTDADVSPSSSPPPAQAAGEGDKPKPAFLDQLAEHQAKQAVEAGATTVVVDPLQQRMEEEAELEGEEDANEAPDDPPPKSTPPEPSGELEFQ